MQVHVTHLFIATQKRIDEQHRRKIQFSNKIKMREGINVSLKYVYLSLKLVWFPFVHDKKINMRILRVNVNISSFFTCTNGWEQFCRVCYLITNIHLTTRLTGTLMYVDVDISTFAPIITCRCGLCYENGHILDHTLQVYTILLFSSDSGMRFFKILRFQLGLCP